MRRDEAEGSRFGQNDKCADVRTFEQGNSGQHASAACHPEQGHVDRRATGTDTGRRSTLSVRLAVVHRAGVVVAAGARAEFLDRLGARQHDRRSESGHLAHEPGGQQPRHVTADELHTQSGV